MPGSCFTMVKSSMAAHGWVTGWVENCVSTWQEQQCSARLEAHVESAFSSSAMLWFWKPCRHWGTDVRHAFKGVALTGRLERLVERQRVPTVLNTAFPNHKIGFHNSFHSSPICLGLISTLHWRLNSLCNQQADSWLVVDSRLESQDYVARCGCQNLPILLQLGGAAAESSPVLGGFFGPGPLCCNWIHASKLTWPLFFPGS